ncbi:MAG: type II secretion system protein [Candidatus Aceula meridiana]|nr:type II secretion system protein [Candidatus Aceula meridiana]
MNRKNALTFLELIVVVILVSIFAAFGVGRYQKLMTSTRQKDAINNLILIKAAQKIYFAKNGEYLPNAGTVAIGEINSGLHLSIVEPNNLTYICEDDGPTNYKCEAEYSGSPNWTCTIANDSKPSC